MRTPTILPLAVLALAACQSEADRAPAVDACDASGWSYLVGQNRDVLAAMTFPAPMRVIGPEDAVTMDYLPNRLNVVYDEDDIITRVECG